MASCDVFLPTCTLNVRRNSEPTRAPADALMCSKLEDFLEAIKPGWFALFANAFAAAGVDVEDFPSLCAKKRDRLEEELQKAGARLLHMKKIRNALDSLGALSSQCDASLDHACVEPTILYQSPMAAYFQEYNCFNAIAPLMCKSPVADCKGKDSLRSTICHQKNEDYMHNANNAHGDKLCSVGKSNTDNKCSLLSSDGLPLKSPMSAYFDGHDSFGFIENFIGFSNSNNLLSPAHVAPSTPISQQNEVIPVVSTNTISQLLGDAKAKNVRWADEVDERKPLQLAELISSSFQTACTLVGGSVWELARDPKGCREVQKALGDCDSIEERVAIAEQLRGHVMDAIFCPHANHVLHKVIESLPPTCSNFIIEEIMQGGLVGVKEVAMHRYGCRIMEGLLRVCDSLQLHEVVEYLLVDVEVLCTHMYGNFVMKSALQNASTSQRQRLVTALMENLIPVCTSFYGCAVITEVFQSSTEAGKALAHMILSVSGLLPAIAKHKHGRNVLEAMMTLLGDDQRRVVVKELALPPLKVAKATKTSRKQHRP